MRKDGSRVFHVSDADAKLSLTDALQRWLRDDSSSEPSGLIRQRRIQIDGNLCQDGRRRLKAGEVVKLLPHTVAAPPTEADIRVVFIDEHVVVVEKPSGLTTMRHADEQNWSGRRQRREATLDDLLPRVLARTLVETKARPKSASKRKTQLPQRGASETRRVPIIPVHRLDRDTSGLMIFARTPMAERSLVEQFRKHSIDRAYLAVVFGEMPKQTIESSLVRDRGDGKRGSTSLPETGQLAVTHVRPLESLNGHTLIECRLETGRTHQIRIHLSEAGHPLCGDKEYRGPLGHKPLLDRSGAPRLALHAAELGFEHPATGKRLNFGTHLPRDLALFVKRLQRTTSD